jgi:hypothetical protein
VPLAGVVALDRGLLLANIEQALAAKLDRVVGA